MYFIKVYMDLVLGIVVFFLLPLVTKKTELLLKKVKLLFNRMDSVHARITSRLRDNSISAVDVILNSSGLASRTVPFVLVDANNRLLLTITVQGRVDPVTLSLTKDNRAELRPYPPLPGSSSKYDFKYKLKYIANKPLMAIEASRSDGSRVFIVLTDDEQNPLQTVVYAPDETEGSDIWFKIQIDQFNSNILEDFVNNTLEGKYLCDKKDYSFASIFDNATDVAQEACEMKNSDKKRVSFNESELTTIAPPTTSSVDSVDDIKQLNNNNQNFTKKYWYVFVIGGIALLIVIVGICMMVRPAPRLSQPTRQITGLNLDQAQNSAPRFLASPNRRQEAVIRPGVAHEYIGAPDLEPDLFQTL